jgi:hypothetical protein
MPTPPATVKVSATAPVVCAKTPLLAAPLTIIGFGGTEGWLLTDAAETPGGHGNTFNISPAFAGWAVNMPLMA